jgi:hypothetical protein
MTIEQIQKLQKAIDDTDKLISDVRGQLTRGQVLFSMAPFRIDLKRDLEDLVNDISVLEKARGVAVKALTAEVGRN